MYPSRIQIGGVALRRAGDNGIPSRLYVIVGVGGDSKLSSTVSHIDSELDHACCYVHWNSLYFFKKTAFSVLK